MYRGLVLLAWCEWYAVAQCGAGFFTSPLTGKCVECPVGTYSSTGGDTVCTLCQAGTVQISTAAQTPQQCEACMAGTYQTGQGMGSVSDCVQCPAGTYQTGLAVVTVVGCVQCRPGTYQPQIGQPFENACIVCNAGQFQTVFGAVSAQACIQCAPGTFQPVIGGGGNCTLCSRGTYSMQDGSGLGCVSCTRGTYQPWEGATSVSACAKCSAGTYQTGTGMISVLACVWCPAGSFQSVEGAVSSAQCVWCPAGTYQSGLAMDQSSACLLCGAGYYQTGAGAMSKQACVLCQAGTYQTASAAQVSSQCNLCQAGKFQTGAGGTGPGVCIACSPGTFLTALGSDDPASCALCPAGTYQSTTAAGFIQNCTLCRAGTYQTGEGMVRSIECISCGAGKYLSGRGMTDDVCVLCETGKYQDNGTVGADSCTPCERGKFQDLRGQTNCSVCGAGTYQPFTGVVFKWWCGGCRAGTFSTALGAVSAATCQPCDAGFYTDVDGNTSCSMCPVGKYSPVAGANLCYSCMSGTYSNSSGSSECTPCAVGKSLASVGGASCNSCGPGEFQFREGAAACIPCSPGQYQAGEAATSCTPCHAGSAQPGVNQSDCLLCTPGTFTPLTGQTICSQCAPGHYQTSNQSTSCVKCRAGTLATGTGLVSESECTNCSAGWYSESEGVTFCMFCGVGSFGPIAGSTVCRLCAPGSYQLETGTTLCRSCLAGSFSIVRGAGSKSDCVSCPSGSFSSGVGQTSCQVCRPGTFADAEGTLECSACPEGTYVEKSGWGERQCTKCPAGTFSSGQGMTSSGACVMCGDGLFSPGVGQKSESVCGICPAGTVSVANKTFCRECVSGELCPAGYHVPIVCVTGLHCNGTHMEAGLGALAILEGNCTGVIWCPAGTQCALRNLTLGKGVIDALDTASNQTYFIVFENGSMSAPLSCQDEVMTYGYARIDAQSGFFGVDGRVLYRLLPQVCSAGHYLLGDTCTPCPQGTFMVGEGALSADMCQPCPAGKYSWRTGVSSCAPCPAGGVSRAPGAIVCSACRAGAYQSMDGGTACMACAAGSYASNPRSVLCVLCEAGSYQPTQAGTGCLACEKSQFSSPGDLGCSPCGVDLTSLDPGFTCPLASLPSVTDAAVWLSLQGENSDDCLSMGQRSSANPVSTSALAVDVFAVTGRKPTSCVTTLIIANRPELKRSWTTSIGALLPPQTLKVVAFNETFYPELCKNQGFGVLFTVADADGEMLTSISGGKAVMSLLDPSGENVLFSIGCSRLPTVDSNTNVPLGMCRTAFCPTMPVRVRVTMVHPGLVKPIFGEIALSPGPVGSCPPTTSWMAAVQLDDHSVPHMAGDTISIQVLTLNQPREEALVVFRFALRILGGVTFLSFHSTYSVVVDFVDQGSILTVVGDSSQGGGAVLGVLSLRLDAAVSGVALVAQIIPSSFQFTLSNAVPYTMLVRTLGFSCRSDSYIDVLMDMARTTSLITNVRRRAVINWRKIQSSASDFPTSIFTVAVGNIMHSYGTVTSTCKSMASQFSLVVQSCRSISGGTVGSPAAVVRVMYQTAYTDVLISSWIPVNSSVKVFTSPGGLTGRYRITAALSNGVDTLQGVDATPYIPNILGLGVAISNEQWICPKPGLSFTVGAPILFSGQCGSFPGMNRTGAPETPSSFFLVVGGVSGVTGLGSYVFPPALISGRSSVASVLLFSAAGYSLSIAGLTSLSSLNQLTVSTAAAAIVALRNTGTSARCVPVVVKPLLGQLWSPFTAQVQVFPGGPVSLQITLSSYIVVSPMDTSLFIPSSTFVVQAVMVFSDGGRFLVQADARLGVTSDDMQISGLAASSTIFFTGNASLVFSFKGVSCVSTVVNVQVLQSAVRHASLVCPRCPAVISLDDDPLSQQFPSLYPSSIPADLVVVRRLLWDGRLVDRAEALVVTGGATSLENGKITGRGVGVSTLHTDSAPDSVVQVTVISRWVASVTPMCNGGTCADTLKLAPSGDGASIPPFSYATSLTLSLFVGLYNGTSTLFPWLQGVTILVNQSEVASPLISPLVFGEILVQVRLAVSWKIPASIELDAGVRLRVQQMSFITLVGPQLLQQMHCSGIWEEGRYTATATLTDQTSKEISPVFTSSPPLANHHSNGYFHAEAVGSGQIHARFGGHEAFLLVSATISSRYFTSVSLAFLPSTWNASVGQQLEMAATLSPWTVSTPWFTQAYLSSKVVEWTSSHPSVIHLSLDQQSITLLADCYQDVIISAVLTHCDPGVLLSSRSVVTQAITVNVVPSQLGDFDFGGENGAPMGLFGIGQIMQIPVFLYVKSDALRAYMVEIELPGLGVEPVDCSPGAVANSQCAVLVSGGVGTTPSVFRAVGAFSQSQLTGRILVATVKCRVLLNTLAALQVRLLQGLVAGGVSIQPHTASFLVRLGTDSFGASSVTPLGSLPPTAGVAVKKQEAVFGDTDGDGTFSTTDVLFMESYMAVVSVSKGEHLVCVENLSCQSTSRLSVWQLLQLKPVRNPGMPASRPDGSDVIFLLRALVGKAFFLASLDIKSRTGILSVTLSLRDYQQRLNPPNAVARLEITTVGNRNLVFDAPFRFTLATSTLSVVCRRDEGGFFSASSLPSTPTVDEQTVGLKIRIQSLDVLGSNLSSVAQDRSFLFNPTGPIASFPISGAGAALPDPIAVAYLPTLNCEHLCDDASLFLDNTDGLPQWINDTAFSVRTFQKFLPVFWGFWPGFSRRAPDVGSGKALENSFVTPYQVDVGVSVGSPFNVSFNPYDMQSPSTLVIGLYRVECTPPLPLRASYGTNLPIDGLFLVNPLVSKVVQLEFVMVGEGDYVVTVTQLDAVGTSRSVPSARLVQSWKGVPAPFVRLVVTPLCTQGVILWSKMLGTAADEQCKIEVTGVSQGPSPVMTFTCKTYPCVFQGFGQIVRPVIKTFVPTSPRVVVQQPILSAGQWTQWRAECVLTGTDGQSGVMVSVNDRALQAGLIRGVPLHSLEISRESVRGVRFGWAAVNFAGVVKAGLNITASVNPPRALRAWLFHSIGFSLGEGGLTTVFKTGSLQAGGKSFLLLKADYRGGYTVLLDPTPGTVEGLSVKGASSDVVVSQVDGGVYVNARMSAGPSIPIVLVEYQGVTLTVNAEVTSLTPARMVLCCAPFLASASSVLSGHSDFPPGFALEDPWIHFVNEVGPPVQLKLVDSSLQITHDPSVLRYVASTGGWVLTAGAPSSGTTSIHVRYTHPGSLVSVEASLVVTMVTADRLDLSTQRSGPVVLKRIHCSASVFERVHVKGALHLLPLGLQAITVAVALSSSTPSVAAAVQGWVEGRGVGSATVIGDFRGLTSSLHVTVVDDSVVVQSVSVPATQELNGIRGITVIPLLANWTLSSGEEVVQADISALASLWLQPNQYISMHNTDAGVSMLLHGNTVGPPSALRVTIPGCPPLAPNQLVAESLLTARLKAPVQGQSVDVEIRLEEAGRRMVITLVASPPVLAFYIQLQTDAPVLGECLTSTASRFGPFFDCNLNSPISGSVILAGSRVTQLQTPHTELAVVGANAGMPIAAVWGFVEVFNGVSAVRYSVQAGVFGLQIASESNHSVDRLMPSLPIVDTSSIFRHLAGLFSLTSRQPLALRDALFALLLLVGRQRNVETRLYSTVFEFSAMFFVTDRFLRPDTNETGIRVLFHTDQFPQSLDGTAMDPVAGGMWVPATHVMDGWYVVEFRQKIPRLTLAVSFDVVTASSRFPWTWQVDQMVETGLPAPACPRLATQTASFLASYQIHVPASVNISDPPYFLQNLVDRVGCSVQVPSRRVLTSVSGNTLTLSVALESLARVRQSNLILMGGWLADQFGAELIDTAVTQEDKTITIERGDLKYINDTRDPPIPCPTGYFFSRNGTYNILPQHAVAGPDCYDVFCQGGYILMDDSGHCIPVPASRDIVWICVVVVLTLVMALSALICCVHLALWKTAVDISEVVFDPDNGPDVTPVQPAADEFKDNDCEPFGDSDERELYFQNIVASTGMDDLSSMMMMDEEDGEGGMTSVYLGLGARA